jgi:hypothetical protein
MPSAAFQIWTGDRRRRLDGIEHAHRSVVGSGPGRRIALQQLNQAYTLLLSAQFQGFCRDLHTEAVVRLVQSITPVGLQIPIRRELLLNRKLDRGNPNPGNIGADFDRLGPDLWVEARVLDPRNRQRQNMLAEMSEWRNAIAHQDFDPVRLGGTTILRLARVRTWRRACHALARSFDSVVRDYLQTVTGRLPWP